MLVLSFLSHFNTDFAAFDSYDCGLGLWPFLFFIKERHFSSLHPSCLVSCQGREQLLYSVISNLKRLLPSFLIK